MIEREIEVLDRAVDESSDIAVELAKLRDAVDGTPAAEVMPTLGALVDRVNALADVLTALSIDLANVNNSLEGNRSRGRGGEA